MTKELSKEYFNQDTLIASPYPSNYVPNGAKLLMGVDYSEDGDYTCKGFYFNGEYHIQEFTLTTPQDEKSI